MSAILIIGASRGLGYELVQQYLAQGWTVHATARKADDLEKLKAAGASAYQADVTDEASLAELARQVPENLELLVVNAGVNVSSQEASLADVDAGEWNRLMQVNALGPLLAARQLSGHVRRPGGTLAIMSSELGSIGNNESGGLYSYRMSKAAVNAAVKSMAIALEQDGIGVIALHPGWVQTDMGGEQAPVSPADSISGLRDVLSAKSPKDGRLFVDYKGQDLPW